MNRFLGVAEVKYKGSLDNKGVETLIIEDIYLGIEQADTHEEAYSKFQNLLLDKWDIKNYIDFSNIRVMNVSGRDFVYKK